MIKSNRRPYKRATIANRQMRRWTGRAGDRAPRTRKIYRARVHVVGYGLVTRFAKVSAS
jgi:hypothetical protein